MKTAYFADKRREHRIPLAMGVTFCKADVAEPVKGEIKNISSYGALAKASTSLPKGTSLKLCLKVPGTGEQIKSAGTVRWSQMNGGCHLGIEFQKKVSLNLPLYEVARLHSQSMTTALTDYSDKRWELLLKSTQKFQHLAYWGTLLWTFSGAVNTVLSQLGGQIGLSSLRFEKVYRQMENLLSDAKLQRKVEASICGLDSVTGKFNDIASVFRLFTQKHHMELTESKRRDIDLNRMVEDKISFLEDITLKLTNKKCKINYLPQEDLPLIFGRYADFARSIDLLLLYPYQSIMFGDCSKMTVQTIVKKKTIQIDVFSDGSKIFEKDYIIIDQINGNFVDQLTPRDAINILGLYYAVISLKGYNAYIV
ncbi:MAG: PilZ domain-containing protein, partial [Deltaproteobacteria bacterium]|nr:PilZ domain-containing protein [Deltaproteobacteria bacterium]